MQLLPALMRITATKGRLKEDILYMESYTLAENIIKAVSDKKGQDIILLDIH